MADLRPPVEVLTVQLCIHMQQRFKLGFTMNRDRLRLRKLLREVALLSAAVGGVLVLFDWLLWPMLFPHGPWWLRIAGDATGVALFIASRAILARLRHMGRPRPTHSSASTE